MTECRFKSSAPGVVSRPGCDIAAPDARSVATRLPVARPAGYAGCKEIPMSESTTPDSTDELARHASKMAKKKAAVPDSNV